MSRPCNGDAKRRRANDLLCHAKASQPRTSRTARSRPLPDEDRQEVVAFIAETCESFQLQPRTSAAAVSFFDRLCALEQHADELWRFGTAAVAAACLILASKFLEVCAPSVAQLCLLCRLEDPQSLRTTERAVCDALGWDLHVPTHHVFVEQILEIVAASEATRTRADLLADMACYEARLLQYSPVAVAAATVMMAWHQLGDAEAEANHTATLTRVCDLELNRLFEVMHTLLDHFVSVWGSADAMDPSDPKQRGPSPDCVYASLEPQPKTSAEERQGGALAAAHPLAGEQQRREQRLNGAYFSPLSGDATCGVSCFF